MNRIEFRRLGVYDLALVTESFDLVLFRGVLYHLRYPLLALDLVSERVRGRLVLQTLTLPGDEVEEVPADLTMEERHRLLADGWPAMAFIEHHFAGDPTNWWLPARVPSHAAQGAAETMGRREVPPSGTLPW